MAANLAKFIIIPIYYRENISFKRFPVYLEASKQNPHQFRINNKNEEEILIFVINPFAQWEDDDKLSDEQLGEQLLEYLEKKTEASQNNEFLVSFNYINSDHMESILSDMDRIKQMYNDRIIHIIFGEWELFERLQFLGTTKLFDGFQEKKTRHNRDDPENTREDAMFRYYIYDHSAIETKIDFNSVLIENVNEEGLPITITEQWLEYLIYLDYLEEDGECDISKSNIFKVFDDVYKCSEHWDNYRWSVQEAELQFKAEYKASSSFQHIVPISLFLYEMIAEPLIEKKTTNNHG